MSVVATAWPIDGCSNKDAGRSESETLTPCEQGTKTRRENTRWDKTQEKKPTHT